MEASQAARLHLRRQFFITPYRVNHGEYFNSVELSGGYLLSYHSDIEYTQVTTDETKIILLGNLFDPFEAKRTNEDILRELVRYPLHEVVKMGDKYSGRYIIIYSGNHELKLFHDFMSHMKVYHTNINGKTWCASQPHTLAGYLNLKKTEDKEKLQYFRSEIPRKNQFVDLFHYTLYDEIRHLQPNHYLDILNYSLTRYWPADPVTPLPLKKVVSESSGILRGYLQSAAERYKLMVPVTAGYESRMLVAATSSFRDQCFYYVNRHSRLKEDHFDIQIPKKIFRRLNIPFHVLEFPEEVDPDFEEIYKQNNQAPNLVRLPVIYNYYKHFDDYYNTPGNGAEIMVYNWLTFINFETDGKMLAGLLSFSEFPFVIKTLEAWLKEIKPYVRKTNIGIPNLLYQEFRIANWATNFQSQKDIAQDEFYPFNSRMLMKLLLSVPAHYRQIHSKLLFKRIARHLWKESGDFPYNPRLSDFTKMKLEQLGLYQPIVRFFAKKPKMNKN